MPCCAVPCCAVLCCAVLCRAVPCRAVPCCAVLCCAVLCCAVLFQAFESVLCIPEMPVLAVRGSAAGCSVRPCCCRFALTQASMCMNLDTMLTSVRDFFERSARELQAKHEATGRKASSLCSLHCIGLCCVIISCIVICCAALCRAVQCYAMPCCAVSCHSVL